MERKVKQMDNDDGSINRVKIPVVRRKTAKFIPDSETDIISLIYDDGSFETGLEETR